LSGPSSSIWITIDAVIYVINGVAIFVMFVCKPTIWIRLQSKFSIIFKRAEGNCLTFFVTKRAAIMNSLSNQQESSGSTNITKSHGIGHSVEAHDMQLRE